MRKIHAKGKILTRSWANFRSENFRQNFAKSEGILKISDGPKICPRSNFFLKFCTDLRERGVNLTMERNFNRNRWRKIRGEMLHFSDEKNRRCFFAGFPRYEVYLTPRLGRLGRLGFWPAEKILILPRSS